MKFARFQTNEKIAYGIVEGDSIREISGSPLFDYSETGAIHLLSAVRLRAPVEPPKMFAMALNYGSHLHGSSPPSRPEPFFKTHTSVIGPDEAIVLPSDSEKVDAESELVVVIGRKAKNVPESEAMGYMFGYTCGNDVSARDWQSSDTSWWRAKSSDTFSPIGPWIVTDIDAGSLDIRGRINGKEVQACNTSEMIFGIAATISDLSRYITLEAGDCIFTGTSGSAGQMHAGDVVEIEIEGIGVLSNPVE